MAVLSLHISGVVEAIYGVGKMGNPGCHLVHLHNFRRDINFFHVPVAGVVLLEDKSVGDIVRHVESPNMGSVFQAP